jgi:hypothetical protein
VKLFKATLYFIEGTMRRVRKTVVMGHTETQARLYAVQWRQRTYPGSVSDMKRSYAFGVTNSDGVKIHEVAGPVAGIDAKDTTYYLDEEITEVREKMNRA